LFLDRLQIRQRQFRVNRFDVIDRVDSSGDVRDIVILARN